MAIYTHSIIYFCQEAKLVSQIELKFFQSVIKLT